MTRAEKRQRIGQLIAENPGRSDREIGRLAGTDHKTVAAVRRDSGGDFQTQQPVGNSPARASGEIPSTVSPAAISPWGNPQHKLPKGNFPSKSPVGNSPANGEIQISPGVEVRTAVDLADDPIETIAAAIETLSTERRVAIVRVLVPEQRPGERCRKHDHAAILGAKVGGMSMHEISKKFDVPYRTVVWIVGGAGHSRPRKSGTSAEGGLPMAPEKS